MMMKKTFALSLLAALLLAAPALADIEFVTGGGDGGSDTYTIGNTTWNENVLINSGVTVNQDGHFNIAYPGTVVATVNGTLTAAGTLYLGRANGGDPGYGTLNVDGGSLSIGTLYMGQDKAGSGSTGTLYLHNATATIGDIRIGYSDGTTGHLRISGATTVTFSNFGIAKNATTRIDVIGGAANINFANTSVAQAYAGTTFGFTVDADGVSTLNFTGGRGVKFNAGSALEMSNNVFVAQGTTFDLIESAEQMYMGSLTLAGMNSEKWSLQLAAGDNGDNTILQAVALEDIPAVPEPATMGLLGLGLAALASRRRGRK